MNLKSFHMVAASPSAAKNMARNIAPKKEEKMKWISVKDQMPEEDAGLVRVRNMRDGIKDSWRK